MVSLGHTSSLKVFLTLTCLSLSLFLSLLLVALCSLFGGLSLSSDTRFHPQQERAFYLAHETYYIEISDELTDFAASRETETRNGEFKGAKIA